jgi:predicted ester cyclase
LSATAEDNAAKTRRYYEALWNRRDFGVIPDWVAPEFVGHYTGLPEPVRGVDGFRAMAEELIGAFPDLRMEIEDVIADRDRVVSRVTMTGTHLGAMSGFAPTGARVEAGLIAIEHYSGGLCVEERANTDDVAIARQIGALPKPGTREERIGQALFGLRARRMRRRNAR